MLKISTWQVFNFDGALRGMRNPLDSHARSDSGADASGVWHAGEADLQLARKLCAAGSDHRKFMRQIMVCADITAPLYWWKQFDTYKVGTVSNSASTMHKLHAKPITAGLFSAEHLHGEAEQCFRQLIETLERLRLLYIETGDAEYWRQLIGLLPSGYNQLRTCTFSYENLFNIYGSRRAHKLAEWRAFCDWIAELPHARELICDVVGK